MKIYLADLNEELMQAWAKVFVDQKDIEIYLGCIFDLTADANISPANGFDSMDGGVDLHLSRFLGWHVQERLRMKSVKAIT